jgi:oxygen-independent coproporphyrinogen-3 oxidase
MAGLYLHVPFCVRKCGYCDFVSEAGNSGSIPRFLDALHKEIGTASRLAFSESETVDSVFFGGGTPSLLEPDQVSGLLERIRRTFRLSGKPEATIEANPGTLSLDKLRGYRRAGVNRISLGVQSFSDRDLAVLGRIHKAGQGTEAFRMTRKAGFDNVGLDLIFGIPGQTEDAWKATLETAVSLSPEHVSAYSLTVHPRTPFSKRIAGGEIRMPDEDGIADLYRTGSAFLKSSGYEHYEISNFAKPGRRCRHNEGYWTFKPYLGFGPSAHSYAGGKRFWNTGNLKRYMDALSQGLSPVAGSERIGTAKRRLEAIALGLRRSEGVTLDLIGKGAGRICDLELEGIALLEGGSLKLTEKGLLLADAVAADLA